MEATTVNETDEMLAKLIKKVLAILDQYLI